MPLFESNDPLDRVKIIFKLMDFDDDGYLHPSDLINTQELIDPESDFGQEVEVFLTHATKTLMKGETGIHDKIDVLKHHTQFNVYKHSPY